MNRLLPLAAAALAIPAFAQQTTQPPKDLAPPVVNETVSVGYVMIPFTVLGDKGAPITDLRKGEVRLLIDGKRVPSDFVHRIVLYSANEEAQGAVL